MKVYSRYAAPKRYHWLLVTLHWLMALVLVLMLAAGFLLTGATPNSSPDKVDHLRGHMVTGTVILGLVAVRLFVRWQTKAPAPLQTGSRLEHKLAASVHVAMYILVSCMLLSGVMMAVEADLVTVVFEGVGVLPKDFSSYWSRATHGVAAIGLLICIVLHVAAALFHQFYRRDGLLSRMWFG